MRVARCVGVLAATALLMAAALPVAEGQARELSRFEGRYAFAGGEAERRRLRDAIDAVVDQLDFIVRELARGEVHRNLRPEPSVTVAVVDDERVTISLGEWGPLDVRLDGRARRVRGPDGRDTHLSAVFRRGRIELREESSRGYRDSWLSLSGDARHLFLQVRVGAPQLPEEIRYALSYRRERT